VARQTVIGADETRKNLEALPEAISKDILRKVTRTIMKEDVLPAAQRRVPVDFGTLQDSLTVRVAKLRRGTKDVGHAVRTREGMFQGEAFYGGFIEYGWFHWKDGSFVPGKSYLRQSLYENSGSKLRKFGRLVKLMLDPLVRKMNARQFSKFRRLLRR